MEIREKVQFSLYLKNMDIGAIILLKEKQESNLAILLR
jgi:hypothetical protein